MSIIPPAVTSTAQLLSGVVASAKTLRDILRDSQDRDLKTAISDLYNEIIDVKARVLDLDEENRKLRAQLENAAKYSGPIPPEGFFFQDGDTTHPLCPNCYQQPHRLISFLTPGKQTEHDRDKLERFCRLCRKTFYSIRSNTAVTG